MTAAVTVPVNVSPEAAERIAELGYQAEVERMLSQVRELLPEVGRFEVWLVPDYEEGGDPGIILDAVTAHESGSRTATYDRFSTWKIATFPPNVCQHFSLSITDEAAHAG
jgi:hypothetical protein